MTQHYLITYHLQSGLAWHNKHWVFIKLISSTLCETENPIKSNRLIMLALNISCDAIAYMTGSYIH